jgi:hypothetical protein
MRRGLVATMWLLSTMVASASETPRVHAYAFDQPEILAAQRVFGIGNAITLLGQVCEDNPDASASFAQWLIVNGEMLKQITTRLADYYRIPHQTDDLQQRVASTMHLKSQLNLSDEAKQDACTSLPETLALPSMNLNKRYDAVLIEVKNPDYLKQKRPTAPAEYKQPEPVESSDDREEQTRSE